MKNVKYNYTIRNINSKDRWIFIKSDFEFELDEPDDFVDLVKTIHDDVNGTIVDNGMMKYSIKNDGYGLIYQWDDLFGTVIIYPENVTETEVVDFLSKYMKK